jgi:2-methylcitrate dehydratase PrpD
LTITAELVDRLRSTRVQDLPPPALDIAKQVCLDGLGVIIAGAGEPLGLGRITFEYMRQLGGPADASVIAGGFKTSAFNAAYANGTLGHALDFDNTWWPLNHPTSPTLPAILAIASRTGWTARRYCARSCSPSRCRAGCAWRPPASRPARASTSRASPA